MNTDLTSQEIGRMLAKVYCEEHGLGEKEVAIFAEGFDTAYELFFESTKMLIIDKSLGIASVIREMREHEKTQGGER